MKSPAHWAKAQVKGVLFLICLSLVFVSSRGLAAPESIQAGRSDNILRHEFDPSGVLTPAFESAVVGCLTCRDPGFDFQLRLPRKYFALSEKDGVDECNINRRLIRVVNWTTERKVRGKRALDYQPPEMIDRFQYEFLLNLVRTAKHFYQSVDNERDRSYGTIGQFTAAYRRVLFPFPKQEWEERLSASVFAYKLGTNTPEFSHMRTGGWAFLEYNMHSHRDKSHRFLLMLAPFGMMKDNVSYKKARSAATRWYMEAAGGVEGLWRLGAVSPSVRAFFIPKYDRNLAYRLHSELALQIQITTSDTFSARWFTEVILVPKVLYLYNSDSVVREVATDGVLRKWPLPGWLGWLDFRKDLTLYLQVEFRLRN